MRSVCLVLALFAALGVGSLRPWLLSHCAPVYDAIAACAQGDCCPAEPARGEPAECTFCAAVVVVPEILLPGDLIAAPAPQLTAVALYLVAYRCASAQVPATAPPPDVLTRHVVLLI